MFHKIETGPCVVCDADTPATCECVNRDSYDYDPTEGELTMLYRTDAPRATQRYEDAREIKIGLQDGRL